MHTKTILTTILLATFSQALPNPLETLTKRIPQSSPSLPPSTLSAAPPNLALKVIALGIGTQNYSCASPSSSPASVGAIASLSDATSLYTKLSSDPLPKNVNIVQLGDSATCLADKYGSDPGLAPLGHHFFSSTGVPQFDLGGKGYLSAKKLSDVPAPAGACAGRDGGKAVDWLQLGDDGSGASKGASMVYRVQTAGGAAASCAGTTTPGQVITHDYAAFYWFYG